MKPECTINYSETIIECSDLDDAAYKAKAFLCPYDFGKNCGRCIGCDLADNGEHPDIYILGDMEEIKVRPENKYNCISEIPGPSGEDSRQVIIIKDPDSPGKYNVIERKVIDR